MNYHNITHCDMLNGPGLRTVLWVSGCSHQCKGCHNPETWSVHSGIPFDEEAKKELLDSLEDKYIRGVTFSGGDPLHEANREEVLLLATEIKTCFPKKDIILYTGYHWEDISQLDGIINVDFVVDGRYIENKKDVEGLFHWRGSYNQRIVDVRASLKSGRTVICEDFS